jgi:hypothetical protein
MVFGRFHRFTNRFLVLKNGTFPMLHSLWAPAPRTTSHPMIWSRWWVDMHACYKLSLSLKLKFCMETAHIKVYVKIIMTYFWHYLYICIINYLQSNYEKICYSYFNITCCVNYYVAKFDFQNQLVHREMEKKTNFNTGYIASIWSVRELIEPWFCSGDQDYKLNCSKEWNGLFHIR